MRFELLTPALPDLGSASGEVLGLPLLDEPFPPQGAAGQVDWRLHARISRLVADAWSERQAEGSFRPADGQHLLMPGRPALEFSWVLLYGLGPRDGWNSDRYRASIETLIGIMANLKARDFTLILPPWRETGMTARLAVELLLRAAAARRSGPRAPFDRLCLVEPVEHHAELSEAAATFLSRSGFGPQGPGGL
jgi:hypothetical protein